MQNNAMVSGVKPSSHTDQASSELRVKHSVMKMNVLMAKELKTPD